MMMSSHEQPMTTIARASSEAQAILSPSAVASTFDDHEAELETQSETEVAKKKARGKNEGSEQKVHRACEKHTMSMEDAEKLALAQAISLSTAVWHPTTACLICALS